MILHVSPINIIIKPTVYKSIQDTIVHVSFVIHKSKYVLYRPTVSILENISFLINIYYINYYKEIFGGNLLLEV